MFRLLLLLLFFYAALQSSGQHNIRFVVKDLTELKRDSIFIAGTFNNWNPAPDNKYKLEPYGLSQKSIVLNLPAGQFEYKYHGGGWLKVEKQWSSAEAINRRIDIKGDTIIYDEVAEWRDLVFNNKRLALAASKDDTAKVWILISLAEAHGFYADQTNTDSGLYYINQAIQLLEKMQLQNRSRQWAEYKRTLMFATADKSALLRSLGEDPRSLELHFRVLQMAQEDKDSIIIAYIMLNIADDYSVMKDYSSSFDYCWKARAVYSAIKKTADLTFERWLFGRLAHLYNEVNIPDSTLYYARRLWQVSVGVDDEGMISASYLLGDNCAARGLPDSAFHYYRLSLSLASNTEMKHAIVLSQKGIAELFKEKGEIDSALYYARAAMATIQNNIVQLRAWAENPNSYMAELSPLLADLYKMKQQPDSAYKYLQLSVELKDSLFNADKQKQLQSLTFSESMRQHQEKQREKEAQEKYETRLKMYGLISGMVVL
ncbi:MAG TPA: glycogen-binding domain-containing protein, partial [Chitinophagaceae bacterium]